MSTTDDPRAALADETRRRQLADARLADWQRQLTDAHNTGGALTRLAASAPGLAEFDVIVTSPARSRLDSKS